MEHFQAALDPRKQELLEARFLGAKVSLKLFNQIVFSDCNNSEKLWQENITVHKLSL